jgi:hypothetical protein
LKSNVFGATFTTQSNYKKLTVMVKTKLSQLTANIGEEIGQDLGAQMISSYRQANPTDVTSYFVGRNIIEQVLAQPGCIGIKFYNAYNEAGVKTVVYVGVNASGAPMLNVTSINADGQLDAQKGIVADRVRTEMGIDGSDWWTAE